MADIIFESVGFDKSLEGAFKRIRAIIQSPNGCNAGVYKPERGRTRGRSGSSPSGLIAGKMKELSVSWTDRI
jgi:hypothetical protein